MVLMNLFYNQYLLNQKNAKRRRKIKLKKRIQLSRKIQRWWIFQQRSSKINCCTSKTSTN
jgi:uncharacterized membrane protein YobD (UPF0266 family)